jgi:predicted nucleic acid-binding protein
VITAVDTSVLLDVFAADRTFGPGSAAEVRESIDQGSLIACEVVWAEVAAFFTSPQRVQEAMDRLGVAFAEISLPVALGAGAAWRRYRRRGGRRDRVVADFLIGAHAMAEADRLLTRDRGFYRTYFASLRVLDPTQQSAS